MNRAKQHNYASYTGGCRCDRCTAAVREYQNTHRRVNQRRLADGTASPVHGRLSTYTNYLCRCADCSAAMSAYHAARRAA